MGNAESGVQPRLPETLTVDEPQADCSTHAHYLCSEDLSVLHIPGQVMAPGIRIYTLGGSQAKLISV